MRKLFCFVLLLCFIAGFAVLATASVDDVYEVSVISVKGDVKADLKGDGNWVSCFEGLKLMKGANLKTGADSSAQIVFDAQGLNVLKLNPNTQITVDDSIVKMPQGSVLANFGNLKPGSSFTVKTPTAACGIRGSGMGVDFINGMTVAKAYKDKVYVQGLDAAGNPVGAVVEVPEGWRTQIEAGNVEPPAELTANELLVWNAFVEAMQSGVGTEAEELEDTNEVDNKDLEEDKEEDEETVISPSGTETGTGYSYSVGM
jgi:hypothetical protein